MAQADAGSQPGSEARNPALPPEGSGLWHQFTQQQLKAWQPNLPRGWVIAIYFVGGFLFAILGCWLLSISMGVTELSHAYTDSDGDSFTLQVTADMKPPIWIYYELKGFHQNHRRYVKSRYDQQMREEKHPPLDDEDKAAGPDKYKSCEPWVTDVPGDQGRVNYPCGLVARSVFNDSFVILWKDKGKADKDYAPLQIDSKAATIAWAADVEGPQRFRNLDPEGMTEGKNGKVQNQELLNMWILNYFPPQVCQQVEFSTGYKPIAVAKKTTEGGHQVPDCTGYKTKPSCKFENECTGPTYKKVGVEDWGVQSGHFLVWMRIAGLPTFRKLWGKIDQTLQKDSMIKVYFQDNFPVKSFGGGKGIVISTSSPLGGRNNFLGIGYICIGICCVLAGVINLVWTSKGGSDGAPPSASTGGHPLLDSGS